MFMLLVGSVIVFSGIVLAVFEAPRRNARRLVAWRIGNNASLGLEFFVGAGIINLILNRTSWAAIAATILIIIMRKLLTFSLDRSSRVV